MLKKGIFMVLVLLISGLPGFAQKKNMDLYLLIGQSNMAGRGKVEPVDTITHPRVFSLDKNNRWVPARDPLHFDKPAAGTGLGRTFGIMMAEKNPDAVIGLIPCAAGGSSIDVWTPGGYHEQTRSYPWDDMEKRVKIAMSDGTLKGILWHQGESDSNPAKCNFYGQKLEDLIVRLRNIAGDQEIPFVAGELGKFKIKAAKRENRGKPQPPILIVVNSTQEVAKNDNHAEFVSSRGLKHKGDNTHFDSRSLRIFGKRYARAMIRLQHQ